MLDVGLVTKIFLALSEPIYHFTNEDSEEEWVWIFFETRFYVDPQVRLVQSRSDTVFFSLFDSLMKITIIKPSRLLPIQILVVARGIPYKTLWEWEDISSPLEGVNG